MDPFWQGVGVTCAVLLALIALAAAVWDDVSLNRFKVQIRKEAAEDFRYLNDKINKVEKIDEIFERLLANGTFKLAAAERPVVLIRKPRIKNPRKKVRR